MQGRIISDDEVKTQVSSSQPYGQWLEDNKIELVHITGANSIYRSTTIKRTT